MTRLRSSYGIMTRLLSSYGTMTRLHSCNQTNQPNYSMRRSQA